MLEEIQQAAITFLGPVTLAYLAACMTWLAIVQMRPQFWPSASTVQSSSPWVDLAWSVAAVVGIFALGEAYRRGWLLPNGSGWRSGVMFTVNNLVIYSPIALVLLIRGQGPATVFLSTDRLKTKLLVGITLGLLAVVVFLTLRRELSGLPRFLFDALRPRSSQYFVAVFFEGIALAFLFVRIRWAFGTKIALLGPAILFAVFHLPRQFQAGHSVPTMATYVVFNTLMVAGILWIAQRSQDIIWLGIVHYLMDVAIKAFDG